MGKPKVRIDKNQSYILDIFLRENIEKCQQKTPEEIAKMCADELGFEISPSTILTTKKAMFFAGVEVWSDPPRKKMTTVEKEIAGLKNQVAGLKHLVVEQDKKFAIVFAKLHALTNLSSEEGDSPFEGGVECEVKLGDMSWSS